MLKNPVVADFVAMLEGLRQQNKFDGSSLGATRPAAKDEASILGPLLLEVLKSLRAIEAKPDQYNYAPLEQYRDLVESIRKRRNA